MNKDHQQVTAQEILSAFHLATLTQSAVQVYVALWNRMAHKGVIQIWLDDDELSVRARIPIRLIRPIQSELVRSGLLFIIPGTSRMLYEFNENPDEALKKTHPRLGQKTSQISRSNGHSVRETLPIKARGSIIKLSR